MASSQLEIAKKAALKAGQLISRESLQIDTLEVSQKEKFDYVSRVDREAEEIIVGMLSRYFPRDGIVAEESGTAINPESPAQWYVDPLDGTTNFVHGFPHYAVSIAFALKGRVMAAVVYDPFKNELFTAERGNGAFLNSKRIRVSTRSDLALSLIGTGFPFKENAPYAEFMPKFERVARATSGLRRAGSAALDLAYVAAGRLDGYWEEGLKPWDLAAGSLLVLEAGGLVTDINGGENYLTTGSICVATPKIFSSLLVKVGDLGIKNK